MLVSQNHRVILGDCVEEMARMDERSIDAIVCDPPYGLEFMGKEWDKLGDVRQPDDPTFHRSGAGPFDRAKVRYGAAPSYRSSDVARANRGTQPDRKRPPGETGDSAKFQLPAPAFDLTVGSQRAMQDWHGAWAREAFRVLKPGGHLLAFGGTRTYHRLACAVEDAGFEIRDTICWLYGSGFPKSLDVSKAIDKAAGAERTEVTGVKAGHEDFIDRTDAHSAGGRSDGWDRDWRADPDAVLRSHQTLAPATPEAEQWEGWGTALKPAHEPIVVARKPLAGTVAANVLAHGTGALNIAGCRIDFQGAADERESKGKNRHADFGSGPRENAVFGEDKRDRGEDGNYDAAGRWPANVILDPDAAAVLDKQTGESVSTGGSASLGAFRNGDIYGKGRDERWASDPGYGDQGGASRFYYVAKTSRAERNAGLDGFATETSFTPMAGRGQPGLKCTICNRWKVSGNPCTCPEPEWEPTSFKRPEVANNHPTVKPIDLMRWLVRLVTPPGGLVLDPFVGSGTTGCAAILEGFDFIGIERDAEYVKIAQARIAFWAAHPTHLPIEKALAAETTRNKVADTGQLSMM